MLSSRKNGNIDGLFKNGGDVELGNITPLHAAMQPRYTRHEGSSSDKQILKLGVT